MPHLNPIPVPWWMHFTPLFTTQGPKPHASTAWVFDVRTQTLTLLVPSCELAQASRAQPLLRQKEEDFYMHMF